MDADLLPELSAETWVASALLEEFTVDLLPAGTNVDLITASRQDATLATVREWIRSESTPAWAECPGLSPELRCWRCSRGLRFLRRKYWERGRPGLVPFVSDRPGAYDRLLLTVYVRWRTGLLVSSDWLRPVTRGGWRAGFLDRGRGSADVS